MRIIITMSCCDDAPVGSAVRAAGRARDTTLTLASASAFHCIGMVMRRGGGLGWGFAAAEGGGSQLGALGGFSWGDKTHCDLVDAGIRGARSGGDAWRD